MDQCWSRNTHAIVAVIAGWVAISAFKQAQRQADAATQQVAIMRNTEEQQLRAYVFLETERIQWPEGKLWPEVVLKAKNFGSTPAQRYHYWACIAFREVPLKTTLIDNGYRFGKEVRSFSLLGSGQSREIYPDICDFTAEGSTPYDLRQSVRFGDKAIYVYGELLYKDVWNEQRWTRFRIFTNDQFGMNEGRYLDPDEGNSHH